MYMIPKPKAAAIRLGVLLTCAVTYAASEKPNLLFVLVDDQRNDSLGCAGKGRGQERAGSDLNIQH